MNPHEAQEQQRNRIEDRSSDNPPWEDENGRLWQTEQGQPILIGYREPFRHAEMAGRLTTADQVERFAKAGNATLTLVSLKTGKRYTFRVRKPDDFTEQRPIWFVSVLKGGDNEADFGYIGQITPRLGYQRGKKCWRDWYAASDAFNWFWVNVENNHMPDVLEVWHEGRCGRCNRKLTVPESVASGFGPECIQHV